MSFWKKSLAADGTTPADIAKLLILTAFACVGALVVVGTWVADLTVSMFR